MSLKNDLHNFFHNINTNKIFSYVKWFIYLFFHKLTVSLFVSLSLCLCLFVAQYFEVISRMATKDLKTEQKKVCDFFEPANLEVN